MLADLRLNHPAALHSEWIKISFHTPQKLTGQSQPMGCLPLDICDPNYVDKPAPHRKTRLPRSGPPTTPHERNGLAKNEMKPNSQLSTILKKRTEFRFLTGQLVAFFDAVDGLPAQAT